VPVVVVIAIILHLLNVLEKDAGRGKITVIWSCGIIKGFTKLGVDDKGSYKQNQSLMAG
jgi:hypothetical protein